MRGSAFKYVWMTSRREVVWFPVALMAFFVVIAWMLPHPHVRYSIARGYLGFFVPLAAGIAAAYAVLDDPALELRFATPLRPVQLLLTRFLLIVAVQAACALAYQAIAAGLGVDLSPLGSIAAVQAAWFVPTLALAALALAGSLAAAQCAAGAFLAGAVWLVQLLMKGWMMQNGPLLYLFMGVLEPQNSDLLASQGVLLTSSVAMLTVSWGLLHRQERYL